ncbi:MAG: hypothetical protein WA913_04250, partial [Pricia sp.]
MTRIKIGIPNFFCLSAYVFVTGFFLYGLLAAAGDGSSSRAPGIAIIFMLVAWAFCTVASYILLKRFKLVYIKNNTLTVISFLPSTKKIIRFTDLESVE